MVNYPESPNKCFRSRCKPLVDGLVLVEDFSILDHHEVNRSLSFDRLSMKTLN